MEKKYIEFLIHNDAHMQEINRLDALHDEIIDEGMDHHIYTRENELPQLLKAVETLLESNYYYDSEIDVMGTIREVWDGVTEGGFSTPKDIIYAIENEIEKRRKRRHKYPVMWDKLEAVGLYRKG